MHAAELVVIGGGPAGIGAAAEATRLGVQTLLLDSRPTSGGQFYARPASERWETGLPDELIEGMKPEYLEVWAPAEVWGGFPQGVLAVIRNGVAELVRGQTIVLATGAMERPVPFPGWERPGVIAAGAAQLLVKESRAVPEGRVVVAGSGPFLLPVATQLLAAGADVRAVVEALPLRSLGRIVPALLRRWERLGEASGYLWRLRTVFPIFGALVRRFEDDYVELSTGDAIPCDVLCVSYGFIPRLALPRLLKCSIGPGGVEVDKYQRTSVEGVYAAGEITGVGGAHLAAVEGRLAGLAASEALGRQSDPNRLASLMRRRARLARFARELWRVYRPVPSLALATPDTVICRCEGVTLSALRRACEDSLGGPRAAKALLRCGMGPCQGVMCDQAVVAATGDPAGEWSRWRIRPPIAPVSVAAVARMETFTL